MTHLSKNTLGGACHKCSRHWGLRSQGKFIVTRRRALTLTLGSHAEFFMLLKMSNLDGIFAFAIVYFYGSRTIYEIGKYWYLQKFHVTQ